jgi:hypothetical protein
MEGERRRASLRSTARLTDRPGPSPVAGGSRLGRGPCARARARRHWERGGAVPGGDGVEGGEFCFDLPEAGCDPEEAHEAFFFVC